MSEAGESGENSRKEGAGSSKMGFKETPAKRPDFGAGPESPPTGGFDEIHPLDIA
jgi:hypothetical protein